MTSDQNRPADATAAFQRNPQHAHLNCSDRDCEASQTIENVALLSAHQIQEVLRNHGWSWDPVQCPEHNEKFQKQFVLAKKAIADASEGSLRLLVLASNVTLDELNEQLPKIRDEIAHKAAIAAVVALQTSR